MTVPIKGQPALVLKQTSQVKAGGETTATSKADHIEKKSIGSFLSNCVDKLANCFTSSKNTAQMSPAVSSFQEPTATGEIQGQVAINTEHLSAEKIADAVTMLTPMRLENSQGADLKQVIETNLNALKTLNEEGVNTDNEIQLLTDINSDLDQNKVDDVTSWANIISKLDTANAEIQRIQSGLSNTESSQIYEFMGVDTKTYVDSQQLKSVRDTQGMWLTQLGVATAIPGSLSNLKADQAHETGIKNANTGNQRGTVQALFKNKPESSANYAEKVVSQTMSGTVKYATKMVFGLMDTLSGSAAYGASKLMGYDNKSLAQVWDNRGATRKLVAKKLYSMLSVCFKKLKGKVSDNSIKKSVGTLKKHGLFGDKKNQLKFGQPLKSKQTIQLYQQINAANMMAGGPSKTNVKDTINANQNIPQTRKESMIQDLDQMSDSEVQNIGLQMADEEIATALNTFEQLVEIELINPDMHTDSVKNLLTYLTTAEADIDVTQIPSEQLAEVLNSGPFIGDKSEQKNNDYMRLRDFIRPRYGRAMEALLTITTQVPVTKERHIRRIEQGVSKLETASRESAKSICNNIEENITGLFKELKNEKDQLPNQIKHINSQLSDAKAYVESNQTEVIKLSQIDDECTVSQLDESIDEVDHEIKKFTELYQKSDDLKLNSTMGQFVKDYITNPIKENKMLNDIQSYLVKSERALGATLGFKSLQSLLKLQSLKSELVKLRAQKTSIFEQEKKLSHTLIDINIFKASQTDKGIEQMANNSLTDAAILEDVEDALEAHKGNIAPENYQLICQDIINGMPAKMNVIKQQHELNQAFRTLIDSQGQVKDNVKEKITKELKYTLESYAQAPDYFDTSKVSESQLNELDRLITSEAQPAKKALETIKDSILTNQTAGILREKAWQTEMMHTGSATVQMGVVAGGGQGLGGVAMVADAAGRAAGLNSHSAFLVAFGLQKYVTGFTGDTAVVGFSQVTNKTNAPLRLVTETAVKSMEAIQERIIENLEKEVTQSKAETHHKDLIEKELLLDYLKDKKSLDQTMSQTGRRFEDMKDKLVDLNNHGFKRNHQKVMNNPRVLSVYSTMYNKQVNEMAKSGEITSEEKHDIDTVDRAMLNFNSEKCGLSTVSLFPKREWVYLTKKGAAANLNA